MVLPLPIAGTGPDRWPSLPLPDRLSEADWTLMLQVLNAMKPGIVAVEAPAVPATASGKGFDASVRVEEDDPGA